jgi:hypothetical protein
MRIWRPTRTLVSLLAVSLSTVSALAEHQVREKCAEPAWVRIDSFVNVPLVGADIAIYDSAGKRIFRKTAATNDQGVFPARVALPWDFRVTATFNAEKQPNPQLQALGQFTLSADIHDYDPVHGIVYINPVTTLVSKVMDASGSKLKRSQTRVRRFLSLPQDAVLGASLRESAGYQSASFSETAFLQQAQQHGGMNAFLDELAQSVTQPSAPGVSFANSAPGEDSIAAYIAQQLASGAIKWAEGEGIGWVMNSAGADTPGATQAEIEQLQNSLADLQSSVEALSNQLAALNRAVLGKLTKLQYDQIAVPALTLSSNVNGVGQLISYYAKGCPPLTAPPTTPPSTYCTNEKVTILSDLNNVSINQSFGTLSTYMQDNGAAGVDGMLHLYSEALGATLPFFRPSDSVTIQNMYAFWKAAQIQAAEVQVELLHVNGAQNNPGGIAQLQAFLGDASANPPTLGTFQNTFTAEAKLIFPAVPDGTVISTADHSMWLITAPVLYYDGGVYVAFCGAPPGGSIQKTAVTSSISISGFDWVSPSTTEAQALVSGWSGSSPNQWLTANTQSSNAPTSSGFGNYLLNDPLECNQLDVTPSTVWTRSGRSVLDLSSGHIDTTKSGDYNWILLDRQLASGEQYYWYPGQ